ncbi:MAG: adenylate/guanylate cyclase domain-containing protein [Alphaproteobacteria bacterium]|nr:adenylate/guanylate cyclase domain-containing protein [Alphaproteobacteria bacterium]
MLFQVTKSFQQKALHTLCLLLLLIVAVAFSDSKNSIRMDLQHNVFDEFNRLNPRQLESDANKVVIIDIDEKSLELIGQWHWPRNIMADLVNSLSDKGAKVIAFDGVFAEADRTSPHILYNDLTPEQIAVLPDSMKQDGAMKQEGAMKQNGVLLNYDEMFADAIRSSQRFITAFTYGRRDRDQNQPLDKKRILVRSDIKGVFLKQASHFEAAAVNLSIYSKSAAGNGSFMAKPDDDGILRRTGMLFSDGKTIYPSLSLEVLRVAELGRKGTIRLVSVSEKNAGLIDTNYRILVGDRSIPVESDGVLYTHYRYFCNEEDVTGNSRVCPVRDYISAYKFLMQGYEEETRAAVEGKIVLVGSSAEGLKDLRSTALQSFRPGVEVHANVIEQILDGQYLLRPTIINGVEALYIFAAGLFFILLAPFIGVLISVALCLVIIALAVFGAYYVYVEYGILIDPVYSSLAVLAIFIVSTILSYARAEARRKQIRNAFGMYVASDVMHDLEKNPENLKLGGEKRELSVMFTDIRNFTRISEGLDPEELIQLMNDFLTKMSDIVMHHEGTVDKYIGDAMMCFWNAPRDVAGHEQKACIAALKMREALAPINEALRIKAEEQGKQSLFLKAGIGINTGECAVGNMGSRQRFAYSALGDAVNLASRLEGQTKNYGVDIIVSQSVHKKTSDFATIELDKIRVIGRDEPIVIYGLLGDAEMANQDHFKNWQSFHNKMLELYRVREFDKALQQVHNCSALVGPKYAQLYNLYERRIVELINQKEDIPRNWDGTIDADNK